MPTALPRITITLEPHVYEVLRRLSAAGGQSMSALVVDFLEVAVPPMERMVVVLEQAKTLPAETKESIRGSLLRAEAELLPEIAAAVEQADMFLAQALEKTRAAGAGERQRARHLPRAASPTPVPVTRGSGRPKVATKAAQKGARRGRV